MSTESSKSAIKEVRDQLFLDTADGEHLSVVTSNLGFHRPTFGFRNDDEWRALAKNLALGSKNVESAFRKILEICLGPDRVRVGALSVQAEIGDTEVTLEDASNLVQVGTIVLDGGTPSEEVLPYCYVDYVTNKVFLEAATTLLHTVSEVGKSVLVGDVSLAATSLVLVDSSFLPTTGYPYTVSIGAGQRTGELVSVTNNDTATSTLTVSTTSAAHEGFKADYIRRPLKDATVAGRIFLVLDLQDTAEMPSEGWVKIDPGTVSEEVVFYDENSFSENTLFLTTPLQFDHSSGASIDLLVPGASVEIAGASQLQVAWEIYDTTHDIVKVQVPKSPVGLRITDASWLHSDILTPTGSTTLSSGTLVTDTVLSVVDASDFESSGLLTLNGVDGFFYVSTGPTSITLASQVGVVLSIGNTVVQQSLPHAGTSLDDGNPRDVAGAAQDYRYPGPYVYSPSERSPSATSATITSLHPSSASCATSILVGRENIEAGDLSLWELLSLPFNARIGSGSGFSEDLNVIDVTLKTQSAGSTLDAPTLIGDSTLAVDTSLATAPADAFPETVAAASANFTIVLDKGNANEEFALVSAEAYVPTTASFTIKSAWVGSAAPTATFSLAHAGGVTVDLVYDVLTVDPTTTAHAGPTVSPTLSGHKIEFLTEKVSLVTSLGFNQTSGEFLLNFGRGRVDYRSRINLVVSPTIYQLGDTSAFPTSNFPYQVTLSPGKSVQEVIQVSANDTALNRLTFASTPGNIHAAGPLPFGNYISFFTGDQETISYQDVDTNDLVLTPPQVLEKHTVGEIAVHTSEFSNPRADGLSYAFLLPPDLLTCVKDMFELVRAAGIKVILTEV